MAQSMRKSQFPRYIWWIQNSAWSAGPPVGSYSVYIHQHHVLLLSPKADSHIIVPLRVDGYVEPGGTAVSWIPRWFICPQTVTHPIINRARCSATR